MAISDKSRKKLWANSGNKCAICKTALIIKSSAEGGCIIGEECHIISKIPKGPRFVENSTGLDSYQNLVLLCPSDHKLIDEDIRQYSIDILIKLKSEHERWVESSLEPNDFTYNLNPWPLLIMGLLMVLNPIFPAKARYFQRM